LKYTVINRAPALGSHQKSTCFIKTSLLLTTCTMNDKSMFLHKVALCLVTLLLIVRSVEPQGRNTIYRTYGNSEIRRTKKTENGTTTKWNTIKGKKNKSGKTNKKHGKGKTNKKNGPSDVMHPTMSPTPALELAGDWTVLGDYIYGEVDEAYSGDSVSISNDGSILLIGSYGASEARVFSLVDTAWFMKGEVLKGAPGTDFGRSTSISNDGMIIVVSQYAHPNLVVGAVKTFVWSGTSWNTYSEDVIGDAAGDGFGIEVDLSGDAKTLVVCARQYARIYQWTDSGWITQHTIREEALGDTLGYATSITEDGNKGDHSYLHRPTNYSPRTNMYCRDSRLYTQISFYINLTLLPTFFTT